MRTKKKLSVLMVLTLLVISLVGCNSKSIKKDFIENIIGEEYIVSAFENNEGIIKANLTGNLSRESLDHIVKEIYSKSKQEKVKEKEIILNVYKDGENIEFTNDIQKNMIFNTSISLENGTYTLKSISEVENIEAGDELDKFSNNKLISAKDKNLEIQIDMILEEMDSEESMKRIKAYVELFLNTNKDKDIENISVTVNSSESKGFFYDTKMDDTLIIIDKDLKISE